MFFVSHNKYIWNTDHVASRSSMQHTLQMFDWIYSNREAFLSNYVEIGRNHSAAKKLQEEHNQFTVASNVSIDSGTQIDGERNLEIDSFNLNIVLFYRKKNNYSLIGHSIFRYHAIFLLSQLIILFLPDLIWDQSIQRYNFFSSNCFQIQFWRATGWLSRFFKYR